MPSGVYERSAETKKEKKKLLVDPAEYSNDIEKYKRYAAGRRAMRKYNAEEITTALEGIINYVLECVKDNKPATIAGMILASGTNKDFYYKAKNGEYDYIICEYIDLNNITADQIQKSPDGILYYQDKSTNSRIIISPCSEIIEKCLLIMENDLQQRSLNDKSMARTTGAIFNLKAVFNYNDKPETEARTVNNTLIVNTDADQTAKAMQLLLNNNTK